MANLIRMILIAFVLIAMIASSEAGLGLLKKFKLMHKAKLAKLGGGLIAKPKLLAAKPLFFKHKVLG